MIHNLAELVNELQWNFGRENVRLNYLAGVLGFEIVIDFQGLKILVTLTDREIEGSKQQMLDYRIHPNYGGANSAPTYAIQLIEDVLVQALNKSIKDQKYGYVYADKEQVLWWH